jgi:hypothetical protein
MHCGCSLGHIIKTCKVGEYAQDCQALVRLPAFSCSHHLYAELHDLGMATSASTSLLWWVLLLPFRTQEQSCYTRFWHMVVVPAALLLSVCHHKVACAPCLHRRFQADPTCLAHQPTRNDVEP